MRHSSSIGRVRKTFIVNEYCLGTEIMVVISGVITVDSKECNHYGHGAYKIDRNECETLKGGRNWMCHINVIIRNEIKGVHPAQLFLDERIRRLDAECLVHYGL